MDAVKASIGRAKYQTPIKAASGNQLIADESFENGGQAQGFTPSELMASSLAACTSITLRMYADRKEWTLEKIEVEVGFETADNVTTFHRNITLEGQLDEEQKQRLADIADKCPMHKVLKSAIQISTTVI